MALIASGSHCDLNAKFTKCTTSIMMKRLSQIIFVARGGGGVMHNQFNMGLGGTPDGLLYTSILISLEKSK